MILACRLIGIIFLIVYLVLKRIYIYPGALVKICNLRRNNSVREYNWKKLVDKILRNCFIEWNNMRRVEIHFGSLIILFDNIRLSTLTLHEAQFKCKCCKAEVIS